MKKFKGIIFDFNGTLILDDELHMRAWRKHAAEIGAAFTDDEYFLNMHGSTNCLIHRYLFGRDVPKGQEKTFGSKKEIYYREFFEQTPPPLADGVKELLAFLDAQGIPHAVATSSEISNVRFFDKIYGIYDLFHGNISYDDGTVRGKPNPDIFLRAGKMLGLPMSEIITVEDSYSGVQACRAAGAGLVVGICPRGREFFRGKEFCDSVIKDFTELEYTELF